MQTFTANDGERDLLDLGATAGVTLATPAQALTRIETWGRH